eukprot:CAMPEP_0201596964 /NCGR_PEP_ID=MMETSP0190_2-20130828/193555_1 /ASSEMBLY_ACC=CAM_ASM_000263 /TAXON_ID=37353 /ORGANISM="Rosalina sp." /LENGTH=92 /DNA_ID=CAMNT_0048057653 /DNA_START=11 /DNA_END=286 /DNA_ORIENTATION=-
MSTTQEKTSINSNGHHHGEKLTDKMTVDDESSSSDDDELNGAGGRDKAGSTTINITSFEIVDHPADLHENEISYHQHKASIHGEPRRLIHIW